MKESPYQSRRILVPNNNYFVNIPAHMRTARRIFVGLETQSLHEAGIINSHIKLTSNLIFDAH